ncbi:MULTISPECIES: DUF167 family protein [Chelatococcus]|uniref:UPF0235 protein GGR16_004163 n=1 Tax=Chelatococcus caeni TaxID=1348468 RepID=A0A840C8A7_9HYPH|nr:MULTISPECIES: DUF167 family protein [Chelatococcus]ALA17509.1 hypothetical protein AL346_08920 [Chelatococcus sp. CO-6]MBB4019116.1 hypothetical protein [Chelatococcus caeni]
MSGAVTRTGEGLTLTVRLTPRGGRDAIEGVEQLADGRAVIKVRVRAVPEDGAANAALTRLLAKSLGVAASAVTLVSGHTARIKILTVAGDAAMLEARLAALIKHEDRP